MDPYVELEWCYAEIGRLTAENARLERKNDNRKKLTTREVATIRDMVRAGYSQAEVADIYDVSPPTVSRIVRGQYWRA